MASEDMVKRLCVIIPNFNGERLLGPCQDSLQNQTRAPDRVIVVDNGSTDRSAEIVRAHPLAAELIALPANQGFAYAVNQGLEAADREIIALLNNDAVADPRWLESGLEAMARHPEISMFSSLMIRETDRGAIDSAGDLMGRDGRPWTVSRGSRPAGTQEEAEVFSACGGAAFYRASLFAEIGGFEESFFAYLEDVDLGFRARWRGHKALLVPAAVVYHGGASTDLGDRQSARAVDSSFRVYWIGKNRIRLIARNFPAGALLRWLPQVAVGLVRGAGYHLLVSRQFPSFARGVRDGFKEFFSDRAFFRAQSGPPAERVRRWRDISGLISRSERPWLP